MVNHDSRLLGVEHVYFLFISSLSKLYYNNWCHDLTKRVYIPHHRSRTRVSEIELVFGIYFLKYTLIHVV